MPSHYEGSPELKRALSAFINFVRAGDLLFARLEAQVEKNGLTLGQFAVMEALLHLGPLNQCDLARKLLRSGGNVTVVVSNLEKRGWVRRVRQPDDRRMVAVHLTPEGRRLIERVFPEHAREVADAFAALSAGEQETLRDLCRKLGRSLEGFKQTGRQRDGQKEKDHGTSSPQ